MTAAPGLLVLDLHNTLYDEVLEFGGAMLAAIAFVEAEAARLGVTIDGPAIPSQLAEGHRRLGSDWDDDVWFGLAEIGKFPDPETTALAAIDMRRETSRALAQSLRYDHALEVVRDRKARGDTVIVATEATANAAADALRWLDLDGVVDAVYSWPFRKPFERLAHSRQSDFPASPDEPAVNLTKPHPLILAQILLDVTKDRGLVAPAATLDQAFALRRDEEVDLSPLLSKLTETEADAARPVIDAIATRLDIQPGPHAAALERLRAECLYVGDSAFKDGFLAMSAGVRFAHAAYGKTVAPSQEDDLARCRDILYRTTGWPPFLLQLTQEAGRLEALGALVAPTLVCRASLHELD